MLIVIILMLVKYSDSHWMIFSWLASQVLFSNFSRKKLKCLICKRVRVYTYNILLEKCQNM